MCFRLPKLAVSAKILICLLMVLCCDSMPLVARQVRLYNQCTWSMLRVNMTGGVAADNSEDGFENLEIRSMDYKGRLLIFGQKARRYLCFTQRGKLIGALRLRKNLRCYFTEEMGAGGYSMFHSSADRKLYLGFTSRGRQLRGKEPANPSCLNWVKIDSSFNIEKHNEVLAGPPKVNLDSINLEMGAAMAAGSRRRYRHRKHHRLHRNNRSE